MQKKKKENIHRIENKTRYAASRIDGKRETLFLSPLKTFKTYIY